MVDKVVEFEPRVEQAFQRFLKSAFGEEELEDGVIQEIRTSFFAGAASVHGVFMREFGTESNEEVALGIIEDIHEELNHFADELMMRKLRGGDASPD